MQEMDVNDDQAIRETMFTYFEGYKTQDRALLERAFATDVACMIGYSTIQTGKLELFTRPIREVIDRWTDPGYTPLELGEGRVLSVEILGGTGASVVFDFGGVFLDAFQLAKIDGTWRIVNKFFVDHP
jgi:hypothetical protein